MHLLWTTRPAHHGLLLSQWSIYCPCIWWPQAYTETYVRKTKFFLTQAIRFCGFILRPCSNKEQRPGGKVSPFGDLVISAISGAHSPSKWHRRDSPRTKAEVLRSKEAFSCADWFIHLEPRTTRKGPKSEEVPMEHYASSQGLGGSCLELLSNPNNF